MVVLLSTKRLPTMLYCDLKKLYLIVKRLYFRVITTTVDKLKKVQLSLSLTYTKLQCNAVVEL